MSSFIMARLCFVSKGMFVGGGGGGRGWGWWTGVGGWVGEGGSRSVSMTRNHTDDSLHGTLHAMMQYVLNSSKRIIKQYFADSQFLKM